jgi:hypothetical protein
MTSELDDLVIAHLREIHAELHAIAQRLEAHDRRFDQIDKGLSGVRPVIEQTLGLATMSQIKLGKVEARSDATDAWQRHVSDRLSEIEGLAKVEQAVRR